MDMSLSKLRGWQWTGRPGVLRSMGSQRIGLSDWTELREQLWLQHVCEHRRFQNFVAQRLLKPWGRGLHAGDKQKYKRQQYLFFQWSTGGRRQHSPGKEIGMASGKSLIHHCLAVWPGASPWPLSSSGRRECCPTTLWFPSLLLQEMCSVTAHFYLIHPSFVYYWMD